MCPLERRAGRIPSKEGRKGGSLCRRPGSWGLAPEGGRFVQSLVVDVCHEEGAVLQCRSQRFEPVRGYLVVGVAERRGPTGGGRTPAFRAAAGAGVSEDSTDRHRGPAAPVTPWRQREREPQGCGAPLSNQPLDRSCAERSGLVEVARDRLFDVAEGRALEAELPAEDEELPGGLEGRPAAVSGISEGVAGLLEHSRRIFEDQIGRAHV